jgi:hypothetical protein
MHIDPHQNRRDCTMSKLMLAFLLLISLTLTMPDQALRYVGPHAQFVGQQLRLLLDVRRVLPSFMQFGHS